MKDKEQAKLQAQKLLKEAEAWILLIDKGGTSGMAIYKGLDMLPVLLEAMKASPEFDALLSSARILKRLANK